MAGLLGLAVAGMASCDDGFEDKLTGLTGAITATNEDGSDITQYFAPEGSWCIDSGMVGFDEMQANWEALEDTTVMLFDVKDMNNLILGD